MASKYSIKSHWIFFMMWPFMAIILAIRSRSISPNLVWAFIVFYGLTFVISMETKDADITRYVRQLEVMHEKELSFNDFIASLYSEKNNDTVDILQPSLTYAVSLFTAKKKVLITLFALVFGFFYSRNIWLVLGQLNGRWHALTILLFIVFLLVVPIWNISGFRFWTAAHIFFYGVMTFITKTKLKGVLVVAGSVLVHFSFLLPVVLFIVYLFIGRYTKALFIFFIFTIFINNVNVVQVTDYVESYIPEVFLDRADSYTSEVAIEQFNKRAPVNKNWYAELYKKGLIWSLTLLLCVFYVRFNKIISTQLDLRKIISFTFLLFGVANLFYMMPSGIRFSIIACLFAATCCIYILHLTSDAFSRRVVYLCLPLLSIFIIVSLREGFDSFGLATVASNVIIGMFIEDNMALIDIVKWRF